MKKALHQAQVIVVPHYDFYRYLEHATLEELGGKIIITSCAYDDRVGFLQERGVDVIIDTAPKVLERVVGLNVLEAMLLAALDKKQDQIVDDDILEVICEQNMAPRVVYPFRGQRGCTPMRTLTAFEGWRSRPEKPGRLPVFQMWREAPSVI